MNSNKPYEDYIHGFWLADEQFCEESEVDSMLLYVGEPEDDGIFKWTVERSAYLIILNDMCNQGLTFKYKTGWAPIGVGKYNISADVIFDEEQIWPDTVDICVDILGGAMKIYSGDTVYARMTKHFEITSMVGKN